MRFTPFGFVGGQTLEIEYLIVGGGAPGESSNASDYAGYGGGAGGYRTGSTSIDFGKSYPIVVGLGGLAGSADYLLQSSSFNNLAVGGGYRLQSGPPQLNINLEPDVICNGKKVKAGGGGASATGSSAYCVGNEGKGGDGGNGLTWFDGNTYAGGGGAGTLSGDPSFAGVGGTGGGGRGAYGAVLPQQGTNGTGGGGGGGGYSTVPGNGGDGIVKIRYRGNQQILGGSITTTDGYTYHTFLSSSALYT